MFLLPWTDLLSTLCNQNWFVGEQEVVFVQGPFQHCHSKESRGGGRQECPLLGHCKVPGWPSLVPRPYVAWV